MNPTGNYAQHDIISIQNIDDEEFVFEFDRASGNYPYNIPTGEIRRFPRFLATHAVKHLIDKILTKRNMKTNNQQSRQELASQIVVSEETFQSGPNKTEAERTKEEVDKLNRPSDLEGVLGKKRQMSAEEIKLQQEFRSNPTTNPAPTPEEHFDGLENKSPTVIESKPVEIKTETTVVPPSPDEIDTTITPPPPAEPKGLPSRSELADYAKNIQKMTFDAKTTKHFQETPVEELVKEIDFPIEGE